MIFLPTSSTFLTLHFFPLYSHFYLLQILHLPSTWYGSVFPLMHVFFSILILISHPLIISPNTLILTLISSCTYFPFNIQHLYHSLYQHYYYLYLPNIPFNVHRYDWSSPNTTPFLILIVFGNVFLHSFISLSRLPAFVRPPTCQLVTRSVSGGASEATTLSLSGQPVSFILVV